MNAKICQTCQTPIPDHAPGGLCPACVLRGADEPMPDPSQGPTLEEVAAAFPKLEILRLIGYGGMGYVYQARQPDLDRMVALKILSPALRKDPAFEERFAREARVLGKLQHPNIVTLYEHGESGGTFYLLMEYIDGVNLRQAMSAGRFTPEQALAIVPALCDALQSAHAQGVWHRDIKPENILLDRDGRVKIADFGIARIVGDPERNFTLTRTGGQLGSAAYMAPEQHEKPHTVDHRADIFSLGVVIYEMLTGELPLGRFPLPSQRAAVNARIDQIVLRTLEKERELRQQSADEVKTDVEGEADKCQSAPSEQPGASRFSRAAIVGAMWPLALPLMIVAWASMMSESPRRHEVPWYVFDPGRGLRWYADVIVWTVFPLGLTAPLATTLLGWISVSQIRHSAGKLYGPGLAVFDGLLFPLLALDAALWFGVGNLWPPNPPRYTFGAFLVEHQAILPLLTLFACVAVDFLIIRRIWRAVNGPKAGPRSLNRLGWKPMVATVVVVGGSAFVFWSQQPRPVGEGVSSESPDGQYIASASTWHAMRIAGSDAFFYRFNVQGRGGGVFEKREIPVPISKLTTNYLAQPFVYYDFGKHGLIDWTAGGRRVSFSVRGVEVFTYDVKPETQIIGPVTERVGKELRTMMAAAGAPQLADPAAAPGARSERDKPQGTKAANELTEAELTLAKQPPVVVETFPVAGAGDVPAGETDIRVRFSKPMADGSWSWCNAWENSLPEFIGPPHFEADGKTCVLKVKLEAGRTYGFWLNSEKNKDFTDPTGLPAVPYPLTFRTKSN